MKISKKAQYALRAVVGIARNTSNRPMPIQELAESETIPLKFLEQILLSLKNGGILASKRGVGGGYRLARSPEQITVGEILSRIDGPFVSLDDQPPNSGLGRCFSELEGMISGFLTKHSIQDIIDMDRESGSMAFEI